MTIIRHNIFKFSLAVLVFGIVFFFGTAISNPLQTHAADTTDICDPITDINCQLPGQQSLFPPGSAGEQLFKDTQNAGQLDQTSITSIANQAGAAPTYSCGVDITCHIVRIIDWVVSALVRIPLLMAAGFLDQAVSLAIGLPLNGVAFVTTGWTIIRDVSNMFYVLILLWVALGTIFDFPRYNIREILPKLVISALLINFSLPLGMLVINTSNALANVFYQGIIKSGNGISGEGQGRLLADKILESTNIIQIINSAIDQKTLADINNYNKQIQTDFDKLKSVAGVGPTGPEQFNCQNYSAKVVEGTPVSGASGFEAYTPGVSAALAAACTNAQLDYQKDVDALRDKDGQIFFARLAAILWKTILMPVLIFVLFAGALLIFVRTITLAFLLIFSPLVFLAYALPETRQYWSQWWDSLLKNSFFLPAFLFCMFLTVTLMRSFTFQPTFQQPTAGVAGLATSNITNAPTIAPSLFMANFQFVFVLMLMLGSLVVAQKLGIAFAGQVRSLGKRAYSSIKRTVQKRVDRRTKSILGRGAGAIAQSEQFQRIANMPVFAKTGIGGFATRTLEKRRRTGEAATVDRLKEKYGGDVTRMKPEQQAALLATASSSDAKTFFNRLEPEDRQKAYEKMNQLQKQSFERKLREGGIGDYDMGVMQKDPRLIAETSNPRLRTLRETDPEAYKNEVIETLRGGGFNYKNASPEFIKSNIGIHLLKSITESEAKQVTATKEGAKAFAEALKKVDTAMKEVTETETIKTGLIGPGVEERIVTKTRMVPPESLSPYLQKIRDTGAFRALQSGTKFSSDVSDIERLEKRLTREFREGQKKPDRDESTPPAPPSEHITK